MNLPNVFKLLPVFFFLLLVFGIGAVEAGGQPSENSFKVTTVLLVRHAEKADENANDPPLSAIGLKRSQELKRVLEESGIKTIYISQYLRTRETAEPIAIALGIAPVVIPVTKDVMNSKVVSQDYLKEITGKIHEKAGENVLIIGHSNTLPDIIKALGGNIIPVIDDKDYDDIFIVTIYATGKASVARIEYGKESEEH